MKYATLTLNPCVDHVMYFEEPFAAGHLNRTSQGILDAGGKGINVSRTLMKLGERVASFGFAGGETGFYLKKKLENEKIDFRSVQTESATRMCVKMIDTKGICTECNEFGGPIKKGELEALLFKTYEMICADEDICYFFLGGSIPRGISNTAYADIISFYKDKNVRFILDAEGYALSTGLAKSPWLIKPNIFELEGLVGFDIASMDEAVTACKTIVQTYGTNVLCTMGKDGSLYVTKEGVWYATVPDVSVQSFAGAGDVYLASFVYMLTNGGTPEDSMRLGSAMATAKVTLNGNSAPEGEMAEQYLSHIKVTKLLQYNNR